MVGSWFIVLYLKGYKSGTYTQCAFYIEPFKLMRNFKRNIIIWFDKKNLARYFLAIVNYSVEMQSHKSFKWVLEDKTYAAHLNSEATK